MKTMKTMLEARTLDTLVAEKVMRLGPFGWSGPPRSNDEFWSHDKSILYESFEEAKARYAEYIKAKYGALRGICDEGAPSYCYWKEGWGPLVVEEYSSDIDAAWLVVQKLNNKGRGYYFTLSIGGDGFVTAEFFGHEETCNTAPLAICLAALKAVGHEVPA